MAIVSLFAVLAIAGGKINVPLPFSPIPMTLQTAVTLASGTLIGSRRGAMAMALYMALGTIGLPIFAHGGGLQSILEPSFGFIIGFIPAAWLTGRICELASASGGNRIHGEFAGMAVRTGACLAGMIVYDVIGVAGLWLNFNFIMGNPIGFHGALALGLIPYILPDLLKIGAVVVISEIILKKSKPL
jgi:biotin transport system substrate-specific component